MNRPVITAVLVSALVLGATGLAMATEDEYSDEDGHNHSTTTTATAAPEEEDEGQGDEVVALADSCDDELLAEFDLHDGFQPGVGTDDVDPRCVDTEFGVVSAFENNPTLLIGNYPYKVSVGEDIVLEVSTRNLVRDRFLSAADGGYYIESATLNEDGLTRGHFHTGCRLLDDSDEAPEPFRLGNQFVATEDGLGSATPDTVTVTVPGFDEKGIVQCAAWAGDGSHRTPMMSFANEIPAFDAVRVVVR